MTLVQILFLLFGLVTLWASLMVVTSPKLVLAALWLILALAGVAALFILLEATFLAVVQVVVYIGAIAILIIFGVMLTRRVMHDTGPQVNKNWWAALLVSLVLFGGLLLMLAQVPALAGTPPPLLADQETLLEDLGRALVDANRYVLPFELASVLLVASMIGAIFVARPASRSEERRGER